LLFLNYNCYRLYQLPYLFLESLSSSDGAFTSLVQRRVTSDIEGFQLTTQNTELSIELLNSALIDRVQTPISYSFSTSTSPWQLTFVFPAFKTLEYDPNFGILVSTSSFGSECNGSIDGGIPVLTIVLVVVLVPTALLCLVILIVALIASTVLVRRYLNRTPGVVNLTGKEEDQVL
jgi:hypothetical protein